MTGTLNSDGMVNTGTFTFSVTVFDKNEINSATKTFKIEVSDVVIIEGVGVSMAEELKLKGDNSFTIKKHASAGESIPD